MYKNMKISLVMPCYNEEEGLKRTLPRVPRIVDEIIVVDGYSTDRTVDIAKQYGAKVIMEKQRGYGKAYKLGFKEAIGDIIATADGDGTYPVEVIPKMIDFMLEKRVKFVSGSRFPLANIQSMPFLNFIGNLAITTIMCILFKHKFFDGTSGAWVIKKEALDKMNLINNKWNFSLEIKIEAVTNPNIGFYEYPIIYYERSGRTKIINPWVNGFKALLFLLFKKVIINSN